MASMEIGRRIIFLVILALVPNCLVSQSLVQNPSFEALHSSFIYLGGIKPVNDWFSPNSGTPDVFRPKSKSFFNNKVNRFGNQIPQDGVAYTNVIFDCGAGYEYVCNTLTQNLISNHIYCISFYLSLMDKSHFIMNGVGADLSIVKPHVNRKEHDWTSGIGLYKYEYYKGQNVVLLDTLISDKENWVYCTLIYRAKGGEKYLTIGNFIPYEHASFYNVQYMRTLKSATFGYSGYYIDNVSLVEISDSSECPCYKVKPVNKPAFSWNEDSVRAGKSIILKDVLFETGSSTLLDVSFPELDKAAAFMLDHPNYSAEIQGHTDNVGDSVSNMRLSESRAQSVVDYIASLGIDRSKLVAKGFGSTEPIVPNDNDENRKMNRRVAIVFILRH